MAWYETQQGKRALDALPAIAAELKKIRVILEDAFREDEQPPPTDKCTCPHPSKDPPGAEHGRTIDIYCPQHGHTEHECTCRSADPSDGSVDPDCALHGLP